jgi:hypothetical protein
LKEVLKGNARIRLNPESSTDDQGGYRGEKQDPSMQSQHLTGRK